MTSNIKEVAAHRPKLAATTHHKVQHDCISCTKVYHYKKAIRRVRGEFAMLMVFVVVIFAAFALFGFRYNLACERINSLEAQLDRAKAQQESALSIPDYTNNDQTIAALEYVWAHNLSAAAEYTEVGR